jgi:hypothetical protein
MGFFDWLFASRTSGDGDQRLKQAVERVIEGTDPRLKAVSHARARLEPAVAHALAFASETVGSLPSCIEMTPAAWSQSALLRAMYVRPADVASTLSNSLDLRQFLGSQQAQGLQTICCAIGATRTERSVFGAAMEGGVLRQDVAQKTVGFSDFRLVGFSANEDLLRSRLEDVILEGLVLAALRDIAGNRQRTDHLEMYRQLLHTRLRLVEQSGAGLDASLGDYSREGRDLVQLRHELAENEAELAALQSGGGGLEAALQPVIDALHNAEAVVRTERISLRLNHMNILVGPEVEDASSIELFEFSTANPDRPRRVAFLATFPRDAVVERRLDFDAVLRSL